MMGILGKKGGGKKWNASGIPGERSLRKNDALYKEKEKKIKDENCVSV